MGFSFKQFYCCGKLKSTTFSLVQQDKNECGKGNEKNGCCDNKYQFFKVKDNHITADEVHSPVKHFVDLHIYTPSFQGISFVSQKLQLLTKAMHLLYEQVFLFSSTIAFSEFDFPLL
ncbi:MAG: hypothetical protein WKG06_10720 [Segetibacter sp.]